MNDMDKIDYTHIRCRLRMEEFIFEELKKIPELEDIEYSGGADYQIIVTSALKSHEAHMALRRRIDAIQYAERTIGGFVAPYESMRKK